MSRKGIDEWLDESLGEGSHKVMHVGSAGPVTKRLREKTALDLTSIDINPEKNPDVVCDLSDMKGVFEDDSFDVVVVMDVLEHVLEPQKAISEVRRVLRPGGKVILSVPFLFEIHAEPHDYWRFTHYGLRAMLRDLADVTIKERNAYAETLVVILARLGKGQGGGKRARALFFVPLAALLWPIALLYDRIRFDNRATSGYLATAVKPHDPGPPRP